MIAAVSDCIRRIVVAAAAWKSPWRPGRRGNPANSAWFHRATVSGAEALQMNTELRMWL